MAENKDNIRRKSELGILYAEIEKHLLNDYNPSDYLNGIYNNPSFRQYPFSMLHKLKQTMQSPKHHPEGNVWNHTLLVVDEAAKLKGESKSPKVFMWAALLHDIGKASTTKNKRGKITAYEHDIVGAKLAREFLLQFTLDEEFVDQVCGLIQYHMQILFVQNKLPFADIEGMKRDTNYREVGLLGLCDRLGRLNCNPKAEKKNIEQFLQACEANMPD